ncbi:2,3-diphosphoglycerate-dependent phosphoglycerate mutase [Thiohalorhabdus methylotrophus]|uniref:2,3-bisphosphoglycerate-dependent phosphoglycerate mutase n=1 Tax=Thiohalorhabdus methylotrophus TaxID=3242694 RepID=A0ABV4TVS2_9GAMM
MPYLALIRHGESQWNLENRFTGWTDVDLSEKGVQQSREAGRRLHGSGYTFDTAFTSYLRRAIRTLWIVQDHMDQMWIPEFKDWRLNERHYGALQGEDKAAFQEIYGKEQVHQWRRSYAVRPPQLEPDDPRHARFEPKYRGLEPGEIPAAESLADTVHRVLPCWREQLQPRLRAGSDLVVAAHGNSLRGLVKYLEGIADDAIPHLDIPLAVPRIYEFGDDGAIRRCFYLREEGEEEL